jgi:uncharacterized protein YxjI
MVGWAAQKLLRLKEAVSVFSDSSRKELLYSIAADRVLDFGARYHFKDAQGDSLGAVQRAGMRSIWKARYDILDTAGSTQPKGMPNNAIMTIREENPWVKVIDGFVSAIPLAEMFTGFFLHPSYVVSRPDGTVVMRIQKQAAFFESRFSVERIAPLAPLDEQRVLLSLMMLVLLERERG